MILAPRSAFAFGAWFGDPGPCPVDDTPHTGCVSADAGTTAGRIVIQQLPMRDDSLARAVQSAPPVVTLQPGEFTTATYRRQKREHR